MVEPKALFDALEARGVGMYVGVPDSLLASFCAYVDDAAPAQRHIIAANEGNAVAIAMGHHLSTGQASVVYMQNSGLGNAVNPLASLADPEVYSVPMLLVIGWRGEPGVHDEPQHVKQGRITPGQLDLLEIPYFEVTADTDPADVVGKAFARMGETDAPVALLVRKDAFAKYKSNRVREPFSRMGREEAMGHLLDLSGPDDLVVSTTGKASRELFELRGRRGQAQRDFLTVGGMGHTASIALGVALGNPARRVLCLDGDGSLLMHMGSTAIIGSVKPANLLHVVLNNAAHESVGGQPTVADRIDIGAIARGCGYAGFETCDSPETLHAAWGRATAQRGPVLMEVRVGTGSRADLGRPTSTPVQNKQAFMRHAGIRD
jgi:phosphonopyruvate decarboxylase